MNVSREGVLDLTELKYVDDQGGARLKEGDVLFNNTNSNELVGKTCWIDSAQEFAFSNHMTRVRLGEGISPSFVARQLHFLWMTGYMRSRCTSHVNQASISTKTLAKTIPLLIPPTNEQNRIVAKLDASLSRVATGEAAAQRALQRLQRYRASVLNAAVTGELTREWRDSNSSEETGVKLLERLLIERRFRWEEREQSRFKVAGKQPKSDKWKDCYPEPIKPQTKELPVLPKGWVWASIDQLTEFVTSGSRGWKSYYSKGGAVFIRSQDIRADVLNIDDAAHVSPPKNSEGMRTQVKLHDLLVTITGANVGKAAPVTVDLPEAYVSQHVALVRFIHPSSAQLSHAYITAPTHGRKELLSIAYGAGKPGLNLENIRALPLPLPSVAEQTQVVHEVERRLAAAEKLSAALHSKLRAAHSLKQSLLREAFGGRLVERDENDESADILLERIHVNRINQASEPKFIRKGLLKAKKGEMISMQPIPSRETLTAAWKSTEVPDAQRLFKNAGFVPNQVTPFYEALRETPEVLEAFAASTSGRRQKKMHKHKARDNAKTQPGRFRLVSLWLEEFKNLKDYSVKFNPEQGVDIVLGWNGTGKSNLFEALLIIFRDLHEWWKKNHWPEKPLNGFTICYEINKHVVEIAWLPGRMKRPRLTRRSIANQAGAEIRSTSIKREQLPLPGFVFGYYSGPTNRLAEHFLPMKQDHYARLREAKSDDTGTLADLLDQRRFFCAETHHAKYVLLAFSYKRDAKIDAFLDKHLRIVGFESALFVIRKPRWARPKSSADDFWGATGIMRLFLERLKQHAVAPMVLEQTVNYGYQSTTEHHYYFFLPNLKTLHALAAEYQDAQTFFLVLESTDFSELIHDVKIQVRVRASQGRQVGITFRELSEGEQQLLTVLGLMRFTKSHQSLVLLDEPDTHLNPHWNVDYLKDLASVVSEDGKLSPEQQTSQLLMATHDPLVIASLIKEQVHVLKRDRTSLRCYWEQADVNPRGLGFTGILTSEMFGFRSDLDPETLADIDNRVRLVGKEGQLTIEEKRELEEIDRRLTGAGFSKAFSDPYYAAFVRAWGKRYADQMADKQFLTKKEREEIDDIAKEVLSEAVAEVENEVATHALH